MVIVMSHDPHSVPDCGSEKPPPQLLHQSGTFPGDAYNWYKDLFATRTKNWGKSVLIQKKVSYVGVGQKRAKCVGPLQWGNAFV